MKTLTNETNTATIVDVAKIAGVSIKTVSRVANGEPNVRDETRIRVQRAIDLLGYSANPYAKQMGSQSRPPVRSRRDQVVGSDQSFTVTENAQQDEIDTVEIGVAHMQRDTAKSNSDRDIDWW